MIRYEAFEETFNKGKFNSYVAFGVRAVETTGNTEVISISDVFTDRKTAEYFAELFNTQKLELVHLNDIIEDLLT